MKRENEKWFTMRALIKYAKLPWTTAANSKSIDHYSTIAQQASKWPNAADLPAGSNAIKLTDLHLQGETRALCVQAVGKASILNHSSGPIRAADPSLR